MDHVTYKDGAWAVKVPIQSQWGDEEKQTMTSHAPLKCLVAECRRGTGRRVLRWPLSSILQSYTGAACARCSTVPALIAVIEVEKGGGTTKIRKRSKRSKSGKSTRILLSRIAKSRDLDDSTIMAYYQR